MKKTSDVKNFFTRTLFVIQLEIMPERFPKFSTFDGCDGEPISSVENVTKHALQELLNLKLIKLEKLEESKMYFYKLFFMLNIYFLT